MPSQAGNRSSKLLIVSSKLPNRLPIAAVKTQNKCKQAFSTMQGTTESYKEAIYYLTRTYMFEREKEPHINTINKM